MWRTQYGLQHWPSAHEFCSRHHEHRCRAYKLDLPRVGARWCAWNERWGSCSTEDVNVMLFASWSWPWIAYAGKMRSLDWKLFKLGWQTMFSIASSCGSSCWRKLAILANRKATIIFGDAHDELIGVHLWAHEKDVIKGGNINEFILSHQVGQSFGLRNMRVMMVQPDKDN